MVSLVNAARAKAGQPTLGFLNPFLYTRYTSFVRDISSGNNLCTENINVCCTQGFYATSGWYFNLFDLL
jgi:tripeptidyl-peptidase-1